ncbi:MAG: RES family NAD+ phosphorylase [Gammaproteobacteria bacterium]
MIPSTTLGEDQDQACYRVISPAYTGTPLSGMGAARQGGRFNRPGQEALYLAMDEPTALAEYKQDNPWLRPGMICTFFTRGLRVADFGSGFDLATAVV